MRTRQIAGTTAFLIAVLGSFPIRADVPVRVISSQKKLTEGVEIGVFHRVNSDADFLKVERTGRFDSRGACEVQLPAGRYRFEALAANEGSLLCIRSVEINVGDEPVMVQLPNAILARAKCLHKGKLLKILQLAVRSLGGRSEARLQTSRRINAAKIYASAHEKLNISFVGYGNNALVSGSASIEVEETIEIVAGGDGWHATKIQLHKDSERMALARASLVFPASEVVIPVSEDTSIVSNRAVIRLRYELRNRKGHRLVTLNSFLDLSNREEFSIGGPLRESTWATVLSKDNGEKSLYSGASLVDSEGCEVDQEKSIIGWEVALRMNTGSELPKNPLESDAIEALGVPSETLAYQLRWEWGSYHESESAPAALQKIDTGQFVIHVPPPWRRQTTAYLGYLDRIRNILMKKTGRDGPKQIVVRWRTNTHKAKARVGGKNAWVSMPFEGLRKAGDPYTGPWFLIHELLHNFGYHHGEEMRRLKEEGDFVLTGARWREEFEPQATSPLSAAISRAASSLDD